MDGVEIEWEACAVWVVYLTLVALVSTSYIYYSTTAFKRDNLNVNFEKSYVVEK